MRFSWPLSYQNSHGRPMQAKQVHQEKPIIGTVNGDMLKIHVQACRSQELFWHHCFPTRFSLFPDAARSDPRQSGRPAAQTRIMICQNHSQQLELPKRPIFASAKAMACFASAAAAADVPTSSSHSLGLDAPPACLYHDTQPTCLKAPFRKSHTSPILSFARNLARLLEKCQLILLGEF